MPTTTVIFLGIVASKQFSKLDVLFLLAWTGSIYYCTFQLIFDLFLVINHWPVWKETWIQISIESFTHSHLVKTHSYQLSQIQNISDDGSHQYRVGIID